MKLEKCNLCDSDQIRFASNSEIYGREYGNGMCFICDGCGGFVGCHDDGRSLGIIANQEMRELKKKCHALFDPLWKTRKVLKRSDAYYKLSRQLGIKMKDCHFGHFDTDMLNKSLSIMSNDLWFLE